MLEPGSPGKNLRFHEFHLIYLYVYIYEIDIACIWNVLNIRHFGGIVVLGFDGSNDFFNFII